MKNLNIMGVHWKIPFLGWGVHEKPIYRRELPKKRGLGQFAELRGGGGGLTKKRGVDTPIPQLQYVIYWHPAFNVNWGPMKIYWWINRMQKLQQNIIFINWNFFINTIILFFSYGQLTWLPKFHFLSLNGNWV